MVTTIRDSPTYLTNGRVAWGIGDTRIASLYRQGYYVPPARWAVHTGYIGPVERGVCGELRLRKENPCH